MFGNLFRWFYSNMPIIRELRRIDDACHRIAVNDMIRLIDFELPGHVRYGDPKRLAAYALQVCSENGEDGIIHEIFRRIGHKTKIFVELGVGDGIENNTSFLLSQGWNGYWIDEKRTFLKAIKGRKDLTKDRLEYMVASVNRENISILFEKLGIPEEFDLLSIDIDQNTYFVWEGLNNYRPRVIIVEYNSAIPSDIDWKVRYNPGRWWNGTQNFGASLKALENLGRKMGYSLIGCDFMGVNAFFVRSELLGDKFLEPYTSENHYEPPRYSMVHRRTHRPCILDTG